MVLTLAVLALLVWSALRVCAWSERGFYERIDHVQRRYGQIIEVNRKRADDGTV